MQTPRGSGTDFPDGGLLHHHPGMVRASGCFNADLARPPPGAPPLPLFDANAGLGAGSNREILPASVDESSFGLGVETASRIVGTPEFSDHREASQEKEFIGNREPVPRYLLWEFCRRCDLHPRSWGDLPPVPPPSDASERPAHGGRVPAGDGTPVLQSPLPPVTPWEETPFTRSAGHTVLKARQGTVRGCDRVTGRRGSPHTVGRSHDG